MLPCLLMDGLLAFTHAQTSLHPAQVESLDYFVPIEPGKFSSWGLGLVHNCNFV